jgi:sucrose-6-phosphate hydrolase SacC (GH32 family)
VIGSYGINIKRSRLMLNLCSLTNPVLRRRDNLRDPSVYKTGEGYLLFYSRYSSCENDNGESWSRKENWSVASVFTKDFITYQEDRDISPKGFASPGDLIFWGGRYILPLQSYPTKPTMLCYIESKDLLNWSKPAFFLTEVLDLPWNIEKRAIDPTFVVDGDTLHCYFVGSDDVNYGGHSNLIGHAVTGDPDLKRWEIISKTAPLIGCYADAPDGAENVVIFKEACQWIMIYSEGLKSQHLAYAVSKDLYKWELMGKIDMPKQKWMDIKYGAPFVWKESEGYWVMILMGHGEDNKTTFGLLTSGDGIHWDALKENQ